MIKRMLKILLVLGAMGLGGAWIVGLALIVPEMPRLSLAIGLGIGIPVCVAGGAGCIAAYILLDSSFKLGPEPAWFLWLWLGPLAAISTLTYGLRLIVCIKA